MQDQADSSEPNIFAQRFREERVRVQPHQGKFAESIGLPRAQVSFRETGERDLKADFLARASEAGLDVNYVLTGRRSPNTIDAATSAIVTAVSRLSDVQRDALRSFLATLG